MHTQNDQLVLIGGESASGKSASLMNLPDEEKKMYLNCESGKRLPFKNKFRNFTITDPYQVHEAFDHAQDNDDYDTIIVDTLTFLMDMFENQYVLGVADTMKGWANYQSFFKTLMLEKVARSEKAVIVLAHTRSDLDEKAMEMRTQVPIKGALKNNGIESYFSTVVATKKVDLKEMASFLSQATGKTIGVSDLHDASSGLLNVTEQDEMLGYKHVFQTQLTKATIGERIRSPMGMFTRAQTYMDNDAGLLLKHLNEYYG